MKRKIFSALLFGAFLMASTSAFVSCKDYDDDIQNLQTQIDTNSKAISEIQKLIQSGSVITSVDKTAGGVTVKLSNGNSFDITNGVNGNDGANGKDGVDGANGKDGSVITIGDNGNWFIDGKDTGMAAQGPQGPQGEQGPQGPQGDPGVPGADGEDAIITAHVWVLSDDLLELIEYKDGVATGKKVSIETLISNGNNQQPQVVVSALMTNDTLVLYGVQGSATPISISLSGNLRSLVFMPKLYLDGIETIEYPILSDTTLQKEAYPTAAWQIPLTASPRLAGKYVDAWKCTQGQIVNGHSIVCTSDIAYALNQNYIPDYNENNPQLIPITSKIYGGQSDNGRASHIYIGARIGVDYHLNPSNSNTVYSDIKGYSVLEPDVVYMNTRATASQLNVTSPEKYVDGTMLFNNANGILTAGLEVKKPDYLRRYPTDLTINGGINSSAYTDWAGSLSGTIDTNKDNVIALQAKTIADNGEEATVTSDYALVMPTLYYLEGLVWRVAPEYKERLATSTRDNINWGDEKGCVWAANGSTTGTVGTPECSARIHVWDSPQEALSDPDGAALELLWNSATGITLKDYMAIHIVRENYQTRKYTLGNMTDEEMRQWGLHYEFNIVDYSIDGNITRDGHYVKFIDKEKGQIIAQNVDNEGNWAGQSETSIDRMPLMQVLVKDEAGNVLLDGYILIHICRDLEPNHEITYPEQSKTWDLCGAMPIFDTNWAMFNEYVLTNGLNNMTKEYFDAHYAADERTSVPRTWLPNPYPQDADGNFGRYLNVYDSAPARGDQPVPTTQLGWVEYFHNTNGTTNHRFTWYLDENELESLTEGLAPGQTTTVTRWIRFNRTNIEAAYLNLYIKMTAVITRQPNGEATFAVKNDNYWFGLNGSTTGWEAIVFDAKEPINNSVMTSFRRNVPSTLVQNYVQYSNRNSYFVNNGTKYYFDPETKTVNAQEYDPTSDTKINTTFELTAKGTTNATTFDQLFCAFITDSHQYADATLNSILNSCAVDVERGAFANDKLYVRINNGSPILIATLDQYTGEIELVNNNECKRVLNAIGYAANHANIDKQMRSFVSVVSYRNCTDECGNTHHIAEIVNDHKFTVSWERPVNFDKTFTEHTIDARTNLTEIFVIDYLKDELYDWRGAAAGYMSGDQQWFWGYYNVKAITLDLNPAHVYTDMHTGTWQPLSSITTMAQLYALYQDGTTPTPANEFGYPWYSGSSREDDGTITDDNLDGEINYNDFEHATWLQTYNFDCRQYNSAAKNSQLVADMTTLPGKYRYGVICYENNGDNVTKFKVRIPMRIDYEWGYYWTSLNLNIDTTLGN